MYEYMFLYRAYDLGVVLLYCSVLVSITRLAVLTSNMYSCILLMFVLFCDNNSKLKGDPWRHNCDISARCVNTIGKHTLTSHYWLYAIQCSYVVLDRCSIQTSSVLVHWVHMLRSVCMRACTTCSRAVAYPFNKLSITTTAAVTDMYVIMLLLLLLLLCHYR